MLWVKAFHIVAVVCWFAAIFYLPRLFVYHAMAEDQISRDRFVIMERKLLNGIGTPSAIATVVLGLWLIVRAKSSLLAGLATLRQSTLAAGAQLNAGALLGYFLASARAFFAGLLLLFPGALSDLLALLIVLLPGRVVAPAVPHPPDDGVIEGEFREIPDDPARLR